MPFAQRSLSTLLFFLIIGCSKDDDGPVIKNCRIREMFFETTTRYAYIFDYHDDGKLKSVTSPNYTSTWDYIDGQVATITLSLGNDRETISFEYPSANLITWTSSKQFNGVTRQFYLYRHGDQVDSLKVIDPENLPLQQYEEFHSKVSYSNNNVANIYSWSKCCTYNLTDIEYDNGLNPATLLRKSTGVFTGSDMLGYNFFGFTPEVLSVNNPIRYIQAYTQSGGIATTRQIEFQYTYSKQGGYPIALSEFVDGNLNGSAYHFVYENCD